MFSPNNARALPLAALLAVGASLAQGVPSIEDCDARAVVAPEDPDSYYCYVLAARTPTLTTRARARLEGIVAAAPERFRARLCLAVLTERGDPVRALELYRASAKGAFSAGDAIGEVFARRGFANLLARRGDFADADAELSLAETAARASGDEGLMAWVWADRALQAEQLLEHARARRLFRRAERLAFPRGYPALQGQILSGLGMVSWSLGDLETAQRYFERDIELWRRVSNAHSEAISCFNLALVSSSLAAPDVDPAQLARLFRDALLAARRSGNRTIEAAARLELAMLELEGDALLAEIEAARRVAVGARDRKTELHAQRMLALALSGLGRRREAEAMLETTIGQADAARRRHDAVHARVLLAELRSRGASADAAISHYEEALDAIEAVRVDQDEEEVRARAFAKWTAPYYQLSALLLRDAGDGASGGEGVGAALRVVERMRARVLLDHIAGTGPGGEPDAQGDWAPPSLSELQSSLGPEEALVSFQLPERGFDENVGDGVVRGTWAIVVSREAVRAFALPARELLEQRVGVVVGLLRRREPGVERLAARLHDDLLREALAWLPARTRSLVVIPDGPLHRLPFEALPRGIGAPPLGVRYRVTMVPSAALWLRWRAMSGPSGGRGVLALVGAREASAAHRSGVLTEVPGSTPRGLPPLPRARREARRIVNALGGEVYEGEAAVAAARDRDAVAGAALLHVAAHAIIDERRPHRSALVLGARAQGDGGEHAGDAVLRLTDVSRLDLRGKVVILSSCRSARGELLSGEGVIGFSHALFAAGARTVVAALWPLRDDEAEALMARVAHHAARGMPIGEALAASQAAMRRDGVPAAGWAAMVVLGDDHAVVRPAAMAHVRGAARRALPPALVIAGLGFGAVGLRRLRRMLDAP